VKVGGSPTSVTLVPCLAYSTLKMEALCSPESSVDFVHDVIYKDSTLFFVMSRFQTSKSLWTTFHYLLNLYLMTVRVTPIDPNKRMISE
jgi:hypothetical protein